MTTSNNVITASSDLYGWVMGRRYLNRATRLPGNATTIFLKPQPLHGPDQRTVLKALHEFGFEIESCGTKVFDAMELRSMWRNLRDWKVWRENAEAYNAVACPVYRLTYDRGDTVSALDFFKKETRKRFGKDGERTRNYLHAPEDQFESILHSKIMLGAIDLPKLSYDELRRFLDRALCCIAEYQGRPDFFILNSLLHDQGQRRLSKGLFGLCAITVGPDGRIERLRYLRGHAWVAAPSPRLPPFSTLYRVLYDSTFLKGSRARFMECLTCYERLFLRKSFRDIEADRAIGGLSGTPSGNLLLAALLPPLIGQSKLNDADSAVARELLRHRDATEPAND